MNDVTSPTSSIDTPITWVDVARRLATIEPASQEWIGRPTCLLRAQVDWSGAIFEVRDASRDRTTVIAWLRELFPRRLIESSDSTVYLQLEGPLHADRLPVEIETRLGPEPISKLFLGSIESAIDFSQQPLASARSLLPVIACHSVKGGTGRTTIAIAIAKLWQRRTKKPILLVDADLEAPGISYLFRQIRPEARIALEDVIALAHADQRDDRADTVRYVASRLADHRLDDGIIVMPLRRELDELASSSIRAEHLSTSEHPFALAQILSDIASASECAGVVVDLRAGLVPLSVQFALDPAVARVLVTSLSGQSLEATSALVRFTARELRRLGSPFPAPLIVVNRVPTVLRETGADDAILRPVLDRITDEVLRGREGEVASDEPVLDKEVEVSPWRLSKIPEISDLQVTSSTWAGFVDQIEASGFLRRLNVDFEAWLEQEVVSTTDSRGTQVIEPTSPGIENRAERRNLLADFSNRLVAAETADQAVESPLVTGPLLALAKRFTSQLPVIVSEGAKGTGKTLTARFLISKGTWDSAVSSLSGDHPSADAPIVPVLGSIQTSEVFQKEIDAQREAVASQLRFGMPQRVDQTKTMLLNRLKTRDDQRRVNAWLDAIAWSAGFEPGKSGAGEKLLRRLKKDGNRVLAIIEGIEELYSDPYAKDTPQILRSLLVDLPLRLRGEPSHPIGLIVFARRDSVDAAVPQNRDQFRINYRDFELLWSDDDVLELAAWLATKANSLELWNKDFRTLPQAEKERRLEKLWGRKLGPDDRGGRRTAEAYTPAWVIAALSDLQGRLVARDLVRFLANAAKFPTTTLEDEQYPTRLLVPRALRQAIKPTSIAKVQETEEEIGELKSVFAKFKRRKEDVRAPIDDGAIKILGLRKPDIELLTRHGILFGDAAPYEVPELFRMGLNLKHSGARHSVINLRRKARQRLGAQS